MELDNELLFDSAPAETLDSFDGVSRVEELETILGEIIDLWDENGLLAANADYEDIAAELFDHAGAILANDSEEYTG